MKKKKNYVLILTSGGIDSTACINFYKNMNFEVEGVFIDYGQPSRVLEYKAVKSIAEYYSINLRKISIKNNIKTSGGVILGRNAFLFFLAMINFTRENGIIGCGIHNGTRYYDCSNEFINQMQIIFTEYSHDTIKIGAPFINFDKKEIFKYCQNQNVPLHLTYSCELGMHQPCGKCATCKDLEQLYASN